jgi:two-component system, sensor histidine kinase and response regulator
VKPSKKNSLKALIVEDNIVNQMLISIILTNVGYKCSVASNGLEALQKVEKEEYKVIIMDVQMPIMDGYTSAKKIRDFESGKRKKTLIVGLTAYAMKGDKEKVLSAGMDYYIAKPFKQEELLSVINKIDKGSKNNITTIQKKEIFMLSNFLKKFHHDVPFIKNLHENFINITEDLVGQIDSHISRRNKEELFIASHKLKGSLAMMEALEEANLLTALEIQVKSNEFVEARLTLTKLLRAIHQVQKKIQEFILMQTQ